MHWTLQSMGSGTGKSLVQGLVKEDGEEEEEAFSLGRAYKEQFREAIFLLCCACACCSQASNVSWFGAASVGLLHVC
jgi:hypothetical protein